MKADVELGGPTISSTCWWARPDAREARPQSAHRAAAVARRPAEIRKPRQRHRPRRTAARDVRQDEVDPRHADVGLDLLLTESTRWIKARRAAVEARTVHPKGVKQELARGSSRLHGERARAPRRVRAHLPRRRARRRAGGRVDATAALYKVIVSAAWRRAHGRAADRAGRRPASTRDRHGDDAPGSPLPPRPSVLLKVASAASRACAFDATPACCGPPHRASTGRLGWPRSPRDPADAPAAAASLGRCSEQRHRPSVASRRSARGQRSARGARRLWRAALPRRQRR